MSRWQQSYGDIEMHVAGIVHHSGKVGVEAKIRTLKH